MRIILICGKPGCLTPTSGRRACPLLPRIAELLLAQLAQPRSRCRPGAGELSARAGRAGQFRTGRASRARTARPVVPHGAQPDHRQAPPGRAAPARCARCLAGGRASGRATPSAAGTGAARQPGLERLRGRHRRAATALPRRLRAAHFRGIAARTDRRAHGHFREHGGKTYRARYAQLPEAIAIAAGTGIMRPMQQPPSEHDFGPSAQDEADLRAHAEDADYAATQDPIALAAAAWFSRRHQLDAGGQADFASWLAQNAAHGRAYALMQDTYSQIRQIPPEIAARWKVAPAAAVSAPRRHWLRAWPYAAAAMLALSVGVGGYEWSQQQASFTQTYATQRGQRLAVNLPDGSSLTLDTDTRLNVSLYPRRREVQLLQGEAMFRVQAKQGLPFDVFSGPLKVTVVGTQFSVRNTLPYDGNLRVAVQQGHVRVAGQGQDQVDLLAGQGVQADAAGKLSAISHLPPDSVAPWRKDRVTVDNLPLGQVLAEFERYGDTGLVVRDPAVARLRIGGSFSLTQLDGFAAALHHLLPVQVVRSNGHSEIRLAPRLQDQRPSAQLAAPLPAPR